MTSSPTDQLLSFIETTLPQSPSINSPISISQNGATIVAAPLFFAVMFGQDETLVSRLLNAGDNVTVASAKTIPQQPMELDNSALRLAVERGFVNIVHMLMEKAKKELSHPPEAYVEWIRAPDSRAGSALWTAAKSGNVDMCKLLLDHGSNVDDPQNQFGSPLYVASLLGKTEVVRLLLANGANAEYRLTGGVFNVDNGETPLMAAARCNHAIVVSLLLEHGVRVNAEGEYGKTALFHAAEHGHACVVKELLNHDAVDISLSTGERILNEVCKNGFADVCQLLLQTGRIDVNQVDSNGMTPLQCATAHSHEECVKLLHQFGARNIGEIVEVNPISSTSFRIPSSISERKIALIITHSPSVENGKFVASTLERIGFQTYTLMNASPAIIRSALEKLSIMQQKGNVLQHSEFEDTTAPTHSISLIYFSGCTYCSEGMTWFRCAGDGYDLSSAVNLSENLSVFASSLQSQDMTNVFLLDCISDEKTANIIHNLRVFTRNHVIISSGSSSETNLHQVHDTPQTSASSAPPLQRLSPFTRSICKELSIKNQNLSQLIDGVQTGMETALIVQCHDKNLLERITLHRKLLDQLDLVPESPVPVSEIYAMQQSPQNKSTKRPKRRLRALSLTRALAAAAAEDHERRAESRSQTWHENRQNTSSRWQVWKQRVQILVAGALGVSMGYATFRFLDYYRTKNRRSQ
mmetsp:Transcript_10662/g.39814  ORF Transcript_10662/g.39814 Transcript_10662/m.39814 type:complete len:695 (-) Transcript_10662:10-2094(-)